MGSKNKVGPTPAQIDTWGNVSVELAEYLRFRAAREGLSSTLTAGWLMGGLCAGCRDFFGIEVNRQGIVRDTQNAAALAAWRVRQ